MVVRVDASGGGDFSDMYLGVCDSYQTSHEPKKLKKIEKKQHQATFQWLHDQKRTLLLESNMISKKPCLM